MSGLPRALAPWAVQLATLSPDLQPVVGDWARRLAAALGPLAGLHVDAGEPDGVAGLTRRGPYERLLLSEWLLATELPDEFLRRASTGEHLFLERSRRERIAARRVVALLDAGPEQLGAPRLAHLALLVVLQARAAAAGGAVEWCVVQRRSGGRSTGFSEDRVRRLLDGHSHELASPAEVEAWRAELASEEGPPPERWLIGGPGLLAAAAPDDATVLVEEEVAPAARRLRVVVSRRRRARSELTLELPPDATAVRLLRDPFARAAALPGTLPGRVQSSAGILFHPGGRRIMVRLRSGELLDVPLPNGPKDQLGELKRITCSKWLVAAGWNRTRRITAVLSGDALWFAGKSVQLEGDPESFPAPAEEGGPVGLLFQTSSTKDTFFLDGRGRMFHAWWRGTEAPRLQPVQWTGDLGVGCCALTWLDGTLHWLEWREAGEQWLRTWRGARGGPGDSHRPESLHLGAGSGGGFIGMAVGGLVLATEDRTGGPWSVRLTDGRPGSLKTTSWLQPPAGATVVGVLQGPVQAQLEGEQPLPADAVALMLLDTGRRHFRLLHARGFTSLHEAPEPVAAAAVSSDARTIAWVTETGGLGAYSLTRQAVILRLGPGEAR